MELDRISMGHKLQELRGDKSRAEVAAALCISKSALAMYERGERIPRDEVKLRIAQYFNTSPVSIFLAQMSTYSALQN